jgi:hypothetical protein
MTNIFAGMRTVVDERWDSTQCELFRVVFGWIQQMHRLSNRTQSTTMPEVRAEWVGGPLRMGNHFAPPSSDQCGHPQPAAVRRRRQVNRRVWAELDASGCGMRRRLTGSARYPQQCRSCSAPHVALPTPVGYVIAQPGRQKGFGKWAPGKPSTAHRQFAPNWIPAQCPQPGQVEFARV